MVGDLTKLTGHCRGFVASLADAQGGIGGI